MAAILDGMLEAEARRAADWRAQTAFGTLIRDDASLENNIASLNAEIQQRENREVMLAGGLPTAVTGASFEVVAHAMNVGIQ